MFFTTHELKLGDIHKYPGYNCPPPPGYEPKVRQVFIFFFYIFYLALLAEHLGT